jgi:hypothetical protein
MPRTVEITRTFSVHISDDNLSDEKALELAKLDKFNYPETEFHSIARISNKWIDEKPTSKKGKGSY